MNSRRSQLGCISIYSRIKKTHNLSTVKEISVIIPEKGVHHALGNRNVVLWAREGQLK